MDRRRTFPIPLFTLWWETKKWLTFHMLSLKIGQEQNERARETSNSLNILFHFRNVKTSEFINLWLKKVSEANHQNMRVFKLLSNNWLDFIISCCQCWSNKTLKFWTAAKKGFINKSKVRLELKTKSDVKLWGIQSERRCYATHTSLTELNEWKHEQQEISVL